MYAIILIVVCIAYVISDVTTHRLPVLYYETFFTYLYGVSILFLLYVFCFLLQGKYNKNKKYSKTANELVFRFKENGGKIIFF